MEGQGSPRAMRPMTCRCKWRPRIGVAAGVARQEARPPSGCQSVPFPMEGEGPPSRAFGRTSDSRVLGVPLGPPKSTATERERAQPHADQSCRLGDELVFHSEAAI